MMAKTEGRRSEIQQVVPLTLEETEGRRSEM
jgi:hypothetical protein